MNRFNQSTVACDISLYENMTCDIVLQMIRRTNYR